MLFNKTTYYNIQFFNKVIFFKYRTRKIKASERNNFNFVGLPFNSNS